MAQFQLADLFEIVVDTVPDRLALVAGDVRLTYAELDRRANRLAHALEERGVQPDDHVAVYSWNRAEWVEAMLACYKIRAVPINVNYRYVRRGTALPVRQRRRRRDPARAELRRSYRERRRRACPSCASPSTVGDEYEQALARPHPIGLRAAVGATTTTCCTPAAPPACPRAWSGATRTSSSPRSVAATWPAAAPVEQPDELAERAIREPGRTLIAAADARRARNGRPASRLLRRRHGLLIVPHRLRRRRRLALRSPTSSINIARPWSATRWPGRSPTH